MSIYPTLLIANRPNHARLLPAVLFSILSVACIGLRFLGSGWLIRRKLSSPLLADVIISSLQLPGEMVNRRSLVFSGTIQFTDIVAVLGWVVLHGPILGAFLAPQLQDGEDSSKLTDHPVLKQKHPDASQGLFTHCSLTYYMCARVLKMGASDFLNTNKY